jgi:hypothetical protein
MGTILAMWWWCLDQCFQETWRYQEIPAWQSAGLSATNYKAGKMLQYQVDESIRVENAALQSQKHRNTQQMYRKKFIHFPICRLEPMHLIHNCQWIENSSVTFLE